MNRHSVLLTSVEIEEDFDEKTFTSYRRGLSGFGRGKERPTGCLVEQAGWDAGRKASLQLMRGYRKAIRATLLQTEVPF